MRFRFIDAERAHYPVRLLCRCMEVSRAGYYAWRGRSPSTRSTEDAELRVAIRASHAASRGTYGSPRVHRDLQDAGRRVSRKRVARLMKEEELAGRHKRRFRTTTDSNHSNPIAANLLMRQFDVGAINVAWATDLTYLATLDGWLYLAVFLDLCSRRVVGYAMGARIDRRLVLRALDRALRSRRDARNVMIHADRGSQYASHEFRGALEDNGLVLSMSRRGNCWDNAVVESFFGTIKNEVFLEEPLHSRAITEAMVADYIDGFYNPVRRHSSLGYVSPIEFELRTRGGVGGGFAPAPPDCFMFASQEVPGCTA